MDLFEDQGFEATTVEQIAERAGVSRRTFFRYFPSKQDVFFADQQLRMAAYTSAMTSARARAPAEGDAWPHVCACLVDLAALYGRERARAMAQHR